MKKFALRRVAAILTALVVVFVPGSVAFAHPLGNFTINHYSRLEISRAELRIRYVLDYAEIPTFQAKQEMDANGDSATDAAETSAYLRRTLWDAQKNLVLYMDARPLTVEFVPGSPELEFSEGQGGLQVMRVAAWFRAPLSWDQNARIEYRDNNFADRLGWREIVAQTKDGVSLMQSNVPAKDLSNELRAYPQAQLANPPDERAASLTIALGGGNATGSDAPQRLATGSFAYDRTLNDFIELAATKQELSFSVIAASLLAAMALGALHAFEPGHGKTIVGAYLVGSRGTAKHALILGLVVTATHTLGVYALGLVTLFASRYILPEQLYPWLGVLSGALVAILGVRLFWEHVRRMRAKAHSQTYAETMSKEQHRRLHEHGHAHRHAPTQSHKHADEPAWTHSHSHAFANAEQEAAHARKHLAPLLNDDRLTWKSLLSLGVSGGLLPCPSALVVMLSAIALGRVAFGLVLIVAFSLGLAGVLMATGIAFLYAGKCAGRFLRGDIAQNHFWKLISMGSALVVTLVGLGIAAESLRLLR